MHDPSFPLNFTYTLRNLHVEKNVIPESISMRCIFLVVKAAMRQNVRSYYEIQYYSRCFRQRKNRHQDYG